MSILAALILIPMAFVFVAAMDALNLVRYFTQDKRAQNLQKFVPALSHKETSVVIQKMREDKAVLDAAIHQKGDVLSLLLIVLKGTSTA